MDHKLVRSEGYTFLLSKITVYAYFYLIKCNNLQVLKSLSNLRNLNLLGNPVADNEKSTKKVVIFIQMFFSPSAVFILSPCLKFLVSFLQIRSALPNLQIFNTKPVNKNSKINTLDIKPVNDFDAADDVNEKEEKAKEKKPKRHLQIEGRYDDDNGTKNDNHQSVKEKKWKRQRSEDDILNKEVRRTNETTSEKKVKSSKKRVSSEIDAIDNGETSFAELFDARPTDNPENGIDKVSSKTLDGVLPQGDSTMKKKKKRKKESVDPSEFVPSTMEVGMGGASTWDD